MLLQTAAVPLPGTPANRFRPSLVTVRKGHVSRVAAVCAHRLHNHGPRTSGHHDDGPGPCVGLRDVMSQNGSAAGCCCLWHARGSLPAQFSGLASLLFMSLSSNKITVRVPNLSWCQVGWCRGRPQRTAMAAHDDEQTVCSVASAPSSRTRSHFLVRNPSPPWLGAARASRCPVLYYSL